MHGSVGVALACKGCLPAAMASGRTTEYAAALRMDAHGVGHCPMVPDGANFVPRIAQKLFGAIDWQFWQCGPYPVSILMEVGMQIKYFAGKCLSEFILTPRCARMAQLPRWFLTTTQGACLDCLDKAMSTAIAACHDVCQISPSAAAGCHFSQRSLEVDPHPVVSHFWLKF